VQLPFADASFDACVFVAGLHGLPEAAQRMMSLRELRRVMRPGAPVQVTVWSRAAPRFRDLPEDQVDVVVPWKAGGLSEDRNYHLYTSDTLRIHLLAAGFQVEDVREVAITGETPDNLVAWARS
jgi:ubiquinone/menaquinone biosynthesis C-methylase UbiE